MSKKQPLDSVMTSGSHRHPFLISYRAMIVIAIDFETRDPNLTKLGPGWCRNDGYVIGYAVAAGDFVGYYPIRHEKGNLPKLPSTG